MKKFFISILSIVICLSACLPISAATPNESLEEVENITAFIQNADTIKEEDNYLQISKTTCLSNCSIISRSGDSIKSYSTEFMNIVPVDSAKLDEIKNEVYAARSGGGSNYKWINDKSLTIKMSLTIYYDEITSGGDTYVNMTRIDGEVSGAGSGTYFSGGVRMSSAKANITQQGCLIGGGATFSQTVRNDYSKQRTWTYSPSNWKPVAAVNGGSLVGVSYIVTLSRNSGSWDTERDNFLYEA